MWLAFRDYLAVTGWASHVSGRRDRIAAGRMVFERSSAALALACLRRAGKCARKWEPGDFLLAGEIEDRWGCARVLGAGNWSRDGFARRLSSAGGLAVHPQAREMALQM